MIENTHRDLNIALMNGPSVVFQGMEIDTAEVLATAGPRWDFLPFGPGLVGGHCIGVDPHCFSELRNHGTEVFVADCHADASEVAREHGIELGTVSAGQKVDALVVAVAHDENRALQARDLRTMVRAPRPVIADLKSLFNLHQLEACVLSVFRL